MIFFPSSNLIGHFEIKHSTLEYHSLYKLSIIGHHLTEFENKMMYLIRKGYQIDDNGVSIANASDYRDDNSKIVIVQSIVNT